MQLSYFPRVYPDELLYSVVARWRRHLGWPTPSETAKSLFGDVGRTRAIVDVPGQLGELVGRLPPTLGHDASTLIDRHTLFSYVTAFLNGARAGKVRAHMIGANDRPHQHLGPRKDGIDFVTDLRFCTTCAEEMTARFGETYWKRSHQLPSSLVCDEHEDWLIPYIPGPTQARPAYVPAPLLNEIKDTNGPAAHLRPNELIIALAKLGRRLVEAGEPSIAGAIRIALLEADNIDQEQAIDLARDHLLPAFSGQKIPLQEKALRAAFTTKRAAPAPIYCLIAATCLTQTRNIGTSHVNKTDRQ